MTGIDEAVRKEVMMLEKMVEVMPEVFFLVFLSVMGVFIVGYLIRQIWLYIKDRRKK